MNIVIGLLAAIVLLSMGLLGLVAYRRNRARRLAPPSAPQYPPELTEPDTQAGRI